MLYLDISFARASRRFIAALAAGLTVAGCIAAPERETAALSADTADDSAEEPADTAGEPETAEAPHPLLPKPTWELPCVAGAWVTPPEPCACPEPGNPEYTPECAALDCKQTDLLLLVPDGDAASARLRYSAKDGQLSAVSGAPAEGTWTFFDDGELRLEFDGNASYTPTECSESGMQMKGHAPMSHPDEPLEVAILLAWLTGQWDSVPYFP
jgi:hypothetical protein